jgi:hypothetical protein
MVVSRKIVAFAALGFAATSAVGHADDFDARLARQCPAAQGWINSHPSQQHSDERMAARDARRHFSSPGLRKELAERYAKDQKVRDEWIATGSSKASTQAMLAVDAGNLAWLKPLISKQGFPTVAQVGEQGVSHAWMLVQHATGDPALQARVLRELAARIGAGGVSKQDYALLKDRVLLEQGKKQIYGTQFTKAESGKLVPRPLEDPTHVDERRASMDLMPLADYQCVLEVMYTPSSNPKHGPSA